MTFSSIEFAIFLPIVFCLYWFVFNRSLKLQNLFIVIVSYIFYGWWDWRFLFLIAFTSTCSWASGLLIDAQENKKRAKMISATNIILNLCILGIFKYYDFFASSFADLFLGGHSDNLLLNIVLPVGISFYTFQALSYSIDVYKGKIKPTKDIIEFCAFVSFFPQLVAGPIERATNLLPQFQKEREFDLKSSVDGCRQILWGLFKKIVIADNCALYVNKVFSTYSSQSGSTLMLAAILFAFQIYGDFSGYSDIAIGTSKLFGITLMRNFNVPYLSRDIAEFWRRWHISLTTWFRDYVYIPLGGSRCSKTKIVRNTFVIFLLSGIWHGANWTFLAWGAYNAFLFLPLILSGKNRKYRNTVAENKIFPSVKECMQILWTFVLVTLGWIIFRAESIGQAWDYFVQMCANDLFSIPYLMTRSFYLPLFISILVLIIVEWVGRSTQYGYDIVSRIKYRPVRWAIYYATVLALFLFRCGEPIQFIYFQF